MNAYKACQRLYEISNELTKLADQLGRTTNLREREVIEKDINIIENEFFNLKHQLKNIELTPIVDNIER